MFAPKRTRGRALDIDSTRAFLEIVQQRETLSFFHVIHATLIHPFLSPLNPVSRVFWPEFLGLMVSARYFYPDFISRSIVTNANIFTRRINPHLPIFFLLYNLLLNSFRLSN